ncbi:MAG: SH3 domain-containing protein [Eubacteriales bacterium]
MSKRIISLMAVVVLLAAMFAFTTTASAYYCVYSHCPNGKPLNVREGPGKEYPVIGKVPYGDPIYIIGETSPGWYQLNDIGYVQASLTSNSYPGPYVPPAPTPTPDPNKKKADLEKVYASARTVEPYLITLKATERSKGVANVRWAPSKTSKLLKAYPAGTQLRVIAELDKWYQVEDPMTNQVGFVNTAYVVK